MSPWFCKSKKPLPTEVKSPLKHECSATQWGPSMWTSIHWATVNYPTGCNDKLKDRYWAWAYGFGYTLPCAKCRHNWRCIMKSLQRHRTCIMATNQNYACMFFDIHNIWNSLLGKPQFSFSVFQTVYQVLFSYVPMFDQISNDQFELTTFTTVDVHSSDASSASSNNQVVATDATIICVLDMDPDAPLTPPIGAKASLAKATPPTTIPTTTPPPATKSTSMFFQTPPMVTTLRSTDYPIAAVLTSVV
jgi:hypothetical protein